MPRPVEALPCGSRSMISTRSPMAASAVPRLIAVVVLPTPPFWLAMARMRGSCGTPGLASPGNGRISPEFAMSAMMRVHSARFYPFSPFGVAASERPDDHDPPGRACPARDQVRLNLPLFSGFGQFSLYILALGEQRLCTCF